MAVDCPVHVNDGNLVGVAADVWNRERVRGQAERLGDLCILCIVVRCWKWLKNEYRRLDGGRTYSENLRWVGGLGCYGAMR